MFSMSFSAFSGRGCYNEFFSKRQSITSSFNACLLKHSTLYRRGNFQTVSGLLSILSWLRETIQNLRQQRQTSWVTIRIRLP